MASISGGSVVWQLDIDDTKFKSKLKSASDSIRTSSNQAATEGSKNWGKMGATIGVVAGAAQAVFSKAMDAITSSVGDAISRVDALNNFPRIMSNLGIATEDSSKVIKQLSDDLIGLPTTLDDAALSVQRFTASTGDVAESREIFLALNNAILAGGAPMQLQASALEQFSQGFAKGRIDMMEWRTLMQAMPAQLKQLASALKFDNVAQLGEALREGDLSMQDFSKALIDLNKNGTGNFKNFEEQARNATQGIGTGMVNMRTAITRSIANILDVIGQANISNAFVAIGNAVSTASKVIASALQATITFFQENEWAMAALRGVAIGLALVLGKVLVIALWGLAGSLWAVLSPMLPLIAAGVAIGLAALVIKKNWDKIKPVIDRITEAFRTFWEFIKPVREFVVNQLKSAFESIVSIGAQLWQSLQPVIQTIKEILANKAVQNVLKVIGAVLLAIVAAPIVTFFATLIAVITVLSKVLGFLATHFATIRKVLGIAVKIAIAPFVIGILLIVKTVQFLIKIFKAVPNALKSVTNFFKKAGEVVGNVFETILDVVTTVMEAIWNVIKYPLEFIKNLFIIVFGGILLLVLYTFRAIYNTVVTILTAVWNVIRPILQFIWNLFKTIFGFIYQSVSRGLRLVLGVVRSVLTTMYNIVFNTLTRVFNFYKSIFTRIFNVVKSIVTSIINFFRPAATWLLDKGKAIIRGLINGIRSLGNAVWNAVKFVADKIGSFFRGAWNWLYDTGKAIIQGLINGIKNMAGAVFNAVGDIAGGIKNKITGFFGIRSPSKMFMGFGENLGQGLAKGMGMSRALLENAVGGFGDITQTGFTNAVPLANDVGTGGNVTNNSDVNIGTIVLGSREATQEFFDQLNQDTLNIGFGLTPRQGA